MKRRGRLLQGVGDDEESFGTTLIDGNLRLDDVVIESRGPRSKNVPRSGPTAETSDFAK